jgi:CRP/FNR family cyclic AMP-dependent transcriptional regulator
MCPHESRSAAGNLKCFNAMVRRRPRIFTAFSSHCAKQNTQDQHALSDRFITYMLARNIRIEEDLVDQLFNSSEKRLARTLLLLARYGKPDQTHRVLPRISQETLAEMVGTTRSRVNFFMNKFKKLGFIEYNGGLKVHHSLLTVIVHD